MKNESNETRLVSALNMRWVAVGLLVMVVVWAVCLVGTHLIWSHGGGGMAQAMLSLALLTVFPLVGAVGLIAYAVHASGVRRRMLVSAGLGIAVGGILLTGFMLVNANRRAAVENIFCTTNR